ncbi:hypothetical protein F5Y14DRAFT_435225 [Nemania sp. NC0429]|nr:hypothetical protein F5Y14DRAFT_435225 [Nemania sp. NC0429]
MAPGGRFAIPFLRTPRKSASVDRPERPPELKNTLEPSPKECAEVKRLLVKASNFPPELVDIVMDFAEYWACSVTSIDYSVTANNYLAIHGGVDREDKFILRTEPLGLTAWHPDDYDRWQAAAPPHKLVEEYPRKELERFVEGPPSTLEHPFRKIVFDIVSRDQGWGGNIASHHTYQESWTWFDAGIDRFDKGHRSAAESEDSTQAQSSSEPQDVPTTSAIRPLWPPLKSDVSEYHHQLHPTSDHMIQCNRLAEHDWQHHHIEWSWKDDIDPESSAGQELKKNGRGDATGDGRFLRSLKLGDMVTVWGRARFGGWTNSVEKVQVKVYWAQ